MALEIIQSDALADVRHGFFTRKGGASSGIFEGLNCGRGSSDQADIVTINRTRVATAMGVDIEHLQSVHQYHSADVIVVDAPLDTPSKADGMVTNTPGLALGILTADCQPILFADTNARVVGACHAGWKGAVGGVIATTIRKMEDLGAKRDHIVAIIGPCISQSTYEVGPEFFEKFFDEDPTNARYFANGVDGKYQFDLPGFGLATLWAEGVGHAEWTGHCTYSDPARFFSYRRATHNNDPDYGRLISCIRL